MSEDEKEKLAAAGKMALGIARISSGVVTGLGFGLVGGLLRQHHMTHAAMRLGKLSIEGGKRQFDEARADLKRLNSSKEGNSPC